MKKKLKFKSHKSPPTNGKAFLAVLPGMTYDLCFFDKDSNCFRDYFHKQKVSYLIAWAKLPKTYGIYEKFGYGEYDEHTKSFLTQID